MRWARDMLGVAQAPPKAMTSRASSCGGNTCRAVARQRAADDEGGETGDEQAGYFTAAQAKEAGYSLQLLQYTSATAASSVRAAGSSVWLASPRRMRPTSLSPGSGHDDEA